MSRPADSQTPAEEAAMIKRGDIHQDTPREQTEPANCPVCDQTQAQAWYGQVLRRFNEAIALDYEIPFRRLTSGQAKQAQDSREAHPQQRLADALEEKMSKRNF